MDASVEPAACVVASDGQAWGSAFRISNNLLLTALHVVDRIEAPKVQLLGTEELIECTTAWTGDRDDFDIAILRIDNTKEAKLPDVETVSIGQFVGAGRRDCDITGYPFGPDREKVTARRLTGTIDPGAYPGANFLVLELPRPVNLIGFGGGGVCSEGKLVGIATLVNRDENSIILVPASRMLEDAGFSKVIKDELKRRPNVVQLTPPETGTVSALKSVSKADPKNIQGKYSEVG